MNEPIRLSPIYNSQRQLGARFAELAGWHVVENYTTAAEEALAVRARVGVADVSAHGKLFVKGAAARTAVARVFGKAPETVGVLHLLEGTDRAGSLCACLTTDELFISTPPGFEGEVAGRLQQQAIEQPQPLLTVVDQTAGLAGFLVAGPDSRSLLSKLCGLSFHATDFPNHYVAQSSLAKVHAIILRHDLGANDAGESTVAFALYVERSYGEYVWKCIMDAGAEFGVIPFGWGALVSLSQVVV